MVLNPTNDPSVMITDMLGGNPLLFPPVSASIINQQTIPSVPQIPSQNMALLGGNNPLPSNIPPTLQGSGGSGCSCSGNQTGSVSPAQSPQVSPLPMIANGANTRGNINPPVFRTNGFTILISNAPVALNLGCVVGTWITDALFGDIIEADTTGPDIGHWEFITVPCPGAGFGGTGGNPANWVGSGYDGGSGGGGGSNLPPNVLLYDLNPTEVANLNNAENWVKTVLRNAKDKLANLLKQCNPNGNDKAFNNFITCLNSVPDGSINVLTGDLQQFQAGAEGHTFPSNQIVIDIKQIEKEVANGDFGTFQMKYTDILNLDVLHELVHSCGGDETDVQVITSLLGFPRDPRGIDKEAMSGMTQDPNTGDYSGFFFNWNPKTGEITCKNGKSVGTIANAS